MSKRNQRETRSSSSSSSQYQPSPKRLLRDGTPGNVSVKSKFQHGPPGQPPGHLTFLKIIVQIPPYPGQNAVQMPHIRVYSGDQMPPPWGHFTGTKMTEERRKRLQLSNKIFTNIKKLRNTVSVFTTNKSLVQSGGNRCYKVTECSAFLRHATYKAFY